MNEKVFMNGEVLRPTHRNVCGGTAYFFCVGIFYQLHDKILAVYCVSYSIIEIVLIEFLLFVFFAMASASCSVTGKRKRNSLSLNDKIALIELIEAGKSRSEVAMEKNIPYATLRQIYSKRDKIRKQQFELPGSFKKCRTSPYGEVEVALWQWYKQFTSENPTVPIDGNCLKIQATIAAQKLGIDDFKASEGFISRFKARHNIICKAMHGESAAVDPEIISQWKNEKLPKLIAGYEMCDIYNLDEFGLNVRL